MTPSALRDLSKSIAAYLTERTPSAFSLPLQFTHDLPSGTGQYWTVEVFFWQSEERSLEVSCGFFVGEGRFVITN